MANETRHMELIVSLDFDYYPDRHTCKGQDISPKVRIEGLQRRFMALMLEDHDAPERPFVHWVIWNVPARAVIPEGVSKTERPSELDGAVQGSTTGGNIGYEGPCPPRGRTHRYDLKVYGYDEPLDLGPGATREELLALLEGQSTQCGVAAADYGR
jgi:Raf kinase inhibitor-like YbhB/YbcL family protein